MHQQPANGERLMAERAFGEAMKRDGVKRLRQRSGHTWSGVVAEGSFIAFCALFDTTAIAMARGLRGLLQAP